MGRTRRITFSNCYVRQDRDHTIPSVIRVLGEVFPSPPRHLPVPPRAASLSGMSTVLPRAPRTPVQVSGREQPPPAEAYVLSWSPLQGGCQQKRKHTVKTNFRAQHILSGIPQAFPPRKKLLTVLGGAAKVSVWGARGPTGAAEWTAAVQLALDAHWAEAV